MNSRKNTKQSMLPHPIRTAVRTWGGWITISVLFAIVVAIQAYFLWFTPPKAFPVHTIIDVPEGITLDQAVRHLEKENLVRSSLLTRFFILVLDDESSVRAGDYYFEEPLNSWDMAKRIVAGDFGLTPIKVTIPEGATTYQIADILEERLGRFDAVTFLARTKDKEGYLFPDTYYFMPNATIEEVVETMEETFTERIAELQNRIEAFGRPLDEVITMASLLEKEARTLESRRTIAGILWNRLSIDMPLQVDAVFGYIAGTETFHPNYSDLEVESPYNTYKNKGLPPGPIANPGLRSIEAAVTPINSDYIFYLTGRDGNMYYSETYAEHLRNKQLYLN